MGKLNEFWRCATRWVIKQGEKSPRDLNIWYRYIITNRSAVCVSLSRLWKVCGWLLCIISGVCASVCPMCGCGVCIVCMYEHNSPVEMMEMMTTMTTPCSVVTVCHPLTNMKPTWVWTRSAESWVKRIRKNACVSTGWVAWPKPSVSMPWVDTSNYYIPVHIRFRLFALR